MDCCLRDSHAFTMCNYGFERGGTVSHVNAPQTGRERFNNPQV
ncbi:MAG: hypothetical protein WAV47_09210 [Blastocatellia bacterium]